MITYETAKALREAGLKWKPEIGDWFYMPKGEGPLLYWNPETDKELMVLYSVFAPRLDQLLAEIEKRGYDYDLSSPFHDEPYNCFLWHNGAKKKGKDNNSPEEAAAKALLWVLKQKEAGDE